MALVLQTCDFGFSFCSSGVKRPVCILNFVLHMNRSEECATRRLLITLKSKAFGRKSFGKTTWDNKLSDAFSGISDKNFRTSTKSKNKHDTKIYVENN